MTYTMATYKVRPDKIKEVKKAIHEFAAEIRKHEPRTLYLIFREDGRHTFVHWMSFASEAAERSHSQSKYNDRFVRKLLPNCVGKPALSEFRLLAASRKHWAIM